MNQIIKLEPAVGDLLAEARLVKDTGEASHFCQQELWALDMNEKESFKKRLSKLVGFHARNGHPDLRTSEAWETVRDAFLRVLPNCRRCCCIREDGCFVA